MQIQLHFGQIWLFFWDMQLYCEEKNIGILGKYRCIQGKLCHIWSKLSGILGEIQLYLGEITIIPGTNTIVSWAQLFQTCIVNIATTRLNRPRGQFYI